MKRRKSAKINKIINNYKILDSRSIYDKNNKRQCQYLLECQKCNAVFWKSMGFIKNKALCPYCDGGFIMHNTRGHRGERLCERYESVIRRINTHEHYKDIKMCDEWYHDYEKFKEWALNNGYSDELTLDRIDNTKGYCPENCRWVSPKQQANNRRSNTIVKYKGELLTISQLSEKYNVNSYLVSQRLRAGWTVDEAVEKPVDKSRWSNAKKYEEQIKAEKV